jgi:hypothetical protein
LFSMFERPGRGERINPCGPLTASINQFDAQL